MERGSVLRVIEPPDETPVTLTRIIPGRWIRWAFWGLRIYIAAMLVLVIIGFSRGLH